MAHKDWKRKRNKNHVYTHGTWINTKAGLLLTIISDIGFGKQRNVVVENYRKQNYSGYETVKVGYFDNQREAVAFARDYMSHH